MPEYIAPSLDAIREKFDAIFANEDVSKSHKNKNAIDLHVHIDRAMDTYKDDPEVMADLERMNNQILADVFNLDVSKLKPRERS